MPDHPTSRKNSRRQAAPAARAPADLEVLGLVPLLYAYFARARSEMPQELRKTFESHGLTARHGAVLVQLVPGGSMSVSDLARRLGISLSTASELVGNLSDAGLAERREDPANRRRTLVSLQKTYRSAFESFLAVRSAPLLRAMAGLSPQHRAGFVAGLTAWTREVQAQEGKTGL